MRFTVFCFCFFISLFLHAQDADSLFERYKSYPDDTGKVNRFYEKGFALKDSNIPFAIEYAKACYQTAVKVNNNHYLAKALNLMASLKSQTGLNLDALIDFKHALQLRIQIKDTLSQAIILNNLGNVYGSINNNDMAFNCYKSSLRVLSSIQNNSNSIEINRWIYGGVLGIASLEVKMKMYEPAEGNFLTIANWAERKKDYEILAICFNNLGVCKFNLGDTSAAEGYQMQSLDICEMSEDENGKAGAYVNLGEIYLAKKNYKESFSYLQKALEIASKNNYNEGLINAWKKLSEYYNETKNLKAAYFYLAKHDSALTQNEILFQNSCANLWETKNSDEEEQNPPFYFSVKKIFQLSIIGALILILTIVLIRIGNEKKGQEK